MNKKVLLDTNIIIHRENISFPSNNSIGLLYYWLDKLGYEKTILSQTKEELKKYGNEKAKEILDTKIDAYTTLKTDIEPDDLFLGKIKTLNSANINDVIDNIMLFNVYNGYVDLFITEDKKLIKKAEVLNLCDRVKNIDQFITESTSQNPTLIRYKVLSVRPTFFGKVNLNNQFFDSLRCDYGGFDEWFKKKCNEEVYICDDDNKNILGFLYMKLEDTEENYSNICPPFGPKRRVKVGTFKVDSTGFRLGERFLKIIFDYAESCSAKEIYLTIYDDKMEQKNLINLLQNWGFFFYGKVNSSSERVERVMVKRLDTYDKDMSVMSNFPNILYDVNKMILPILPRYHTKLFPDSILNTEKTVDFMSKEANLYSLQKVYISFSSSTNIKKGDIILIYRNGDEGTIKKYTSVVTSVCLLDDFKYSFKNKAEYLDYCKNRTVFTNGELDKFWDNHINKNKSLLVLKLIFVKSLDKRVILEYLQNNGVVAKGSGPRPFHVLSDEEYNKIIERSNTNISYHDRTRDE